MAIRCRCDFQFSVFTFIRSSHSIHIWWAPETRFCWFFLRTFLFRWKRKLFDWPPEAVLHSKCVFILGNFHFSIVLWHWGGCQKMETIWLKIKFYDFAFQHEKSIKSIIHGRKNGKLSIQFDFVFLLKSNEISSCDIIMLRLQIRIHLCHSSEKNK